MKITVEDMINNHFDGNRNVAKEAADVSIFHLNNWVSQGRTVIPLVDGSFLLTSARTKIIAVSGSKEDRVRIPILDMVENEFGGDRNLASAAAGVSIFQFNNWVSKSRDVFTAKEGGFALSIANSKIIKAPAK